MKRFLGLGLLLVLIAQISSGQAVWRQKRYEAVFGLGTSHFFGDIGGFSKGDNILGLKDITYIQTRGVVNVGARYKILQEVAVKFGMTFGFLHADDRRGSNETRDLVAKTTVFEPLLTGEYYFIKSDLENSYLFSKGRRTTINQFFNSFDVFVFTGFGACSYKVRGNEEFTSRGLERNGFAAVIPVGLGANLYMAPDYTLGINIAGRYAFTDKLDGYTSQFSSSNDVYYFLTFTFNYKLEVGRNGLPAFLNRRRR